MIVFLCPLRGIFIQFRKYLIVNENTFPNFLTRITRDGGESSIIMVC